MRMVFSALWHLSLAAFLTALTQIGGAVWLLSRLVPRRRLLVFALGYGAAWGATFAAAPLFEREALPCFETSEAPLAAQSPIYCLLNRHYARPKLIEAMKVLAKAVNEKHPDTLTLYMDAGFPFGERFPLPPHLSHVGGRRVDLAFYYRGAGQGAAYERGATRSAIGYFAFEQPGPGDKQVCPPQHWTATYRWDLDWLQPLLPNMPLEPERTKAMLRWIVDEGPAHGVKRIFVEPYLAKKLGVGGAVIRFQGCHAPRHDDHVHLEITR